MRIIAAPSPMRHPSESADVDGHRNTLAVRLLGAIGLAEASTGVLDVRGFEEELGAEAEASGCTVQEVLDGLQRAGLALTGVDEELPPMLLDPGRQFLNRNGEVPDSVLFFLGGFIDDLNAREALLHGGTVLIDEFGTAIANGSGVDHAQELVPPTFVGIVDERFALDLFAAGCALIARLSCDQPAGCVAEEIMAVALIDMANVWIEAIPDLTEEERSQAMRALKGVYELFQDDDLLDLFAMSETGDAAVAGHSYVNQQLGIADQRPEAWFQPMWGAACTYGAPR